MADHAKIRTGLMTGAALCVALATVSARAQRDRFVEDTQIETLVEKRPRGLTITPRTRGEFSFGADFDDATGDVEVARVGAGVSVGVPLDKQTRLSFGIDEEISFYDFGTTNIVPGAGDPIETATRLNLSARYQRGFGRGWAMVVGGGLRFEGETDADFEDTVTGNGVAIGTRYLSRNLRIGFGGAVSSRLEEDPLILPVFVIDWLITPKLRLRNSGSVGGTAGIELSYEVREQLQLVLDTGFERREFRLDDGGRVPGGVARDKRIPVAVSIRAGNPERFRLEARGGVYAWQEIEILNSSGAEIGESNMNPSAFIGFGLTVPF